MMRGTPYVSFFESISIGRERGELKRREMGRNVYIRSIVELRIERTTL